VVKVPFRIAGSGENGLHPEGVESPQPRVATNGSAPWVRNALGLPKPQRGFIQFRAHARLTFKLFIFTMNRLVPRWGTFCFPRLVSQGALRDPGL
jgi:hypothetical protein